MCWVHSHKHCMKRLWRCGSTVSCTCTLAVQPVSRGPVFSKKGVHAERLCFIFVFTSASTGYLAGSQQGVLGTRRLGVTYDAQLISSILHAQNKLKGFQLHSSHALPQCQLSAARGIWWFCSLLVNGYPHIGRCVFILVTAQRGLHASFCEDLISYEPMKIILRHFIGE